MSASALARTLPTSLSSRTIFVKCMPAPVNFTERRAVLKALCTTGNAPDIEVFQKLEDSSSFIAVTASPGTANALVNDSPFKRIVHLQDSTAATTFSTTAWGAAFRKTITDPINIQTYGDYTKKERHKPERASLGLNSKIFTIHVFPANPTYNHKRAVGRSPLHGPWPPNAGRETFISAALKKTIPASALAPALRKWEAGHQSTGDFMGFEAEGAPSLLGGTTPGQSFIQERHVERKNDEVIPDVMKSLAAVADAKTRQEPRNVSKALSCGDTEASLKTQDEERISPSLFKEASEPAEAQSPEEPSWTSEEPIGGNAKSTNRKDDPKRLDPSVFKELFASSKR
ncbi:hypothetical protein BJ170DRAFT_591410 [Xylariales sp. AK1849]|nr:hypothetical protein BJ170DRAFT_591410 [Xylariales sp. AK1849]